MNRIVFCLIIFLFPIFVFADSGESTVVMDINSGIILYQKNSNDKHLIASITKIMTCIIVLENSNINEKIEVGEEVLNSYGTNIYIEPGEIISIKDLLYGLMLRSGNDAATALAYNTLGYDIFIDKMNAKAKEIGMKNTIFSNPHGLDDETKNYSTAYDMALLAKYAYKNNEYRKIISTKKYLTKSSLKNYTWYNRMNLLTNYRKCIGGKNGYTPKAGKTLVSYAQDKDMLLTIVTLDDSDIYNNHRDLYEYYFNLYNEYTIVDKKEFSIITYDNKKYYIKKSFKYPLKESEIDSVKTLVKINSKTKNKRCGYIIIELDNNEIGKIDIYQKSMQKKKEENFFLKIKNYLLDNL